MTWGHALLWPCGHRALILDPDHNLRDHPHHCPECFPDKQPPVCGIEYLDVHLGDQPS